MHIYLCTYLPRTGSKISLSLDGGGVEGHRLCLGLLAVDLLIAEEAVDLVVGPVGEAPVFFNFKI